MQDYEKAAATLKLMDELAKGKKSGEENGWISSYDVKAYFKTKADNNSNDNR
jgi:hypothetical protein